MNMKKRLAVILLGCALNTALADKAEDQRAVMDVINAFFTGMTAKDIEGMQQLMTEDGVLYGYRESIEGPTFFSLSHAAYLENLATREGTPVERIWDPRIDIHDRIAIVWTPYDFHDDGIFSHCGMNTFSLLNGAGGWKITGVVFSIQTEDCHESPLGAIEDRELQ
jgi:hypothetical protein